MVEYHDDFDPLDELESLVRLAGGYVQASEDLRPRVLEAAHSQRVERWARRRMWQVAVFFMFLGGITSSLRHGAEAAGAGPQVSAGQEGAWFGHPDAAARGGGSSWEMVESFTELRRRQAELLRLAM